MRRIVAAIGSAEIDVNHSTLVGDVGNLYTRADGAMEVYLRENTLKRTPACGTVEQMT
jgi:hypothetical protein